MQCLLSFSNMSVLGPRYDIDELARQGFYKKCGSIHHLEKNIPIHDLKYGAYIQELKSYLSSLEIGNRDQFMQRLDEFLEGSVFNINMNKLMQVGRMMSTTQRQSEDFFVINHHPYPRMLLDELMQYRNHWPLQGLLAFDIANGLLLLRVGIALDYLDDEIQSNYFDKFYGLLCDEYQSFHEFGIDAAIGRNMWICSQALNKNDKLPEYVPSVLSECYYGIWQYIESEVFAHLELV